MNRFPNPSVAAADVHVQTRLPARPRRSVRRHSDDEDDEESTSDGSADSEQEEDEEDKERKGDNNKEREHRDWYADRRSRETESGNVGNGGRRRRKKRFGDAERADVGRSSDNDEIGGGGDAHLEGQCVTVSAFCDEHRRYVQLDSTAPLLVDSPVYYRVSAYRDSAYAASYMLVPERTSPAAYKTLLDVRARRFVSNPFVMSPDGMLRTGPTLLAYDRSAPDAPTTTTTTTLPSSLAFLETRRAQLLVAPELHNVRWPLKPWTDRQTFYVETCQAPPPPSPPPPTAHSRRAVTVLAPGADSRSEPPTAPTSLATRRGADPRDVAPARSPRQFVDPYETAPPRSRPRRRTSTAKEAPTRKTKPRGATRTTSAERHVLRKWRALGEPDPDSVWVVTTTQQATYAIALIIGIVICAVLWHYPHRTVYHHLSSPPPPPPPPQSSPQNHFSTLARRNV
jgi:hypothetical protein